MPHWPKPFGKNIIDLKLTRVNELLNRLGNPQNHLPPVIHVAGTNGKGSTMAFIDAMCQAASLRVHKYTSPHLLRYNERIQIANKEINDRQLFEILEEVRKHATGINPTFFEATTVAAFLAFARYEADIVLLETGMGGRLDATNVVVNPLLSVITPVALDHMEFLGDDVVSIAQEKAGILKENCACVFSWQETAVMEKLKSIATKLSCRDFSWGAEWNFQVTDNGFIYQGVNQFVLPKPNLLGAHQILNAATAIAAIENIAQHFHITQEHIKTAISTAKWPARMEKITGGVLPSLLKEEDELWLDGAHNSFGAQMLAATLSTMPEKRTIMINGRTKNRDIKGFLMPFKNIIKEIIAVTVEWEPMSEEPEKINISAKELGFQSFVAENITEAVKSCIKLANEQPVRIIVCGSLYLAGDILAANKEKL
jgi:dihydrofolate synthase/folylpolyglutamate synthase